ncbi:MAG: Fe-S oxidoreductase, partial [Chitinophagales bacterium]|nr:Fe-S oxidoreductase [Chitinophagales bacterium]
MISSLVFLILSGITAFFAFKRYTQIYANIRLGQPYVLQNSVSQRIKNLLLFSLGQKKMFQRPIAAVFHFFVYAAFIFTQIELIEMILDGLLDRHRIVFHAVSDSWLSFAYTALVNWVEVLSLLAFIATLVFLSRRNLLKLPRLVHEDLKGWP